MKNTKGLATKGLDLKWHIKDSNIVAEVGPIGLRVFMKERTGQEPKWVWHILPALLWDKGKNHATTHTSKTFWTAWDAQRNAEQNFKRIYSKIKKVME